MYRPLLLLASVHLFSMSPHVPTPLSLFFSFSSFSPSFLFLISSLIRSTVRDYIRYETHGYVSNRFARNSTSSVSVFRTECLLRFPPVRYMELYRHAPCSIRSRDVRTRLSVLSRFWCTRLLFSRPAALPPPPCTLHFDSFLLEDRPSGTPSFCFRFTSDLLIIVHVSSSDTLRSPWLFALREDGTWFFTWFFEFFRV